MPEHDSIGVSQDGLVATIEMQRPPHNFFDYRLIREIADVLEQLDGDASCRAIVLAAQGKSFCAGAQFGSGGKDDGDKAVSEPDFRTDTAVLYREAVRLFQTSKPIVAAIHGAAIGGGLGVALVADFRITCPEARFSANFAALGIHPGFGLTVTLPELVGWQAANLMFYTAKRLTGEEACQIGLADLLTGQAKVREKAQELAAQIAANAPLAVMSVRATMRHGLAGRIAARTHHELSEQQRLRSTQDAQEGIRAVAERRAGNFTGQ